MKELKSNLPDSAKQQLISVVGGMYNALKNETPNKEITFEDLMKEVMDRKSVAEAETYFNAMAKGWLLNKYPGYDNIDFKNIYYKLFPNSAILENIDYQPNAIYENHNIKVQYDEEIVNKSSKLQIEPTKKEDAKLGSNTWLYTKERNVRISWYFILPVSFGLFYGWYFKRPQSFNWTAFFLSSLTFLSLFFLFNKKHRKYLGRIHRDLKIVITTILALLILAILVSVSGYTQFIAEKFSIDESDVMGLSYYVYYLAFLIYALWESKDEG